MTTPKIDFTEYKLESGRIVHTTDRICTGKLREEEKVEKKDNGVEKLKYQYCLFIFLLHLLYFFSSFFFFFFHYNRGRSPYM